MLEKLALPQYNSQPVPNAPHYTGQVNPNAPQVPGQPPAGQQQTEFPGGTPPDLNPAPAPGSEFKDMDEAWDTKASGKETNDEFKVKSYGKEALDKAVETHGANFDAVKLKEFADNGDFEGQAAYLNEQLNATLRNSLQGGIDSAGQAAAQAASYGGDVSRVASEMKRQGVVDGLLEDNSSFNNPGAKKFLKDAVAMYVAKNPDKSAAEVKKYIKGYMQHTFGIADTEAENVTQAEEASSGSDFSNFLM